MTSGQSTAIFKMSNTSTEALKPLSLFGGKNKRPSVVWSSFLRDPSQKKHHSLFKQVWTLNDCTDILIHFSSL